jgi:subtilisin family serine protease
MGQDFKVIRSCRVRWAILAAGILALTACTHMAPKDRPDVDSLEYKISWGLVAVNAEPAFQKGASGRGVTIALIDCGVEQTPPETVVNLSPDSIDLNPDRKLPKPENHANFVAGPMESVLDGRGQVGVAYNATLLSIRADFDGGLDGQCAFKSSDLARALDYAREKGARVVVMPLEGNRPLGAIFESALQRATDAGLAIVIAAGNESAADPTYPARYAADPRFAGAIVVAGAANPNGTMAEWSNRAGMTRAYYVLAPGVKVLTDCDEKFCKMVSGTSFATPYVAGALALMMEAQPKLTGRDAVKVLLRGTYRRNAAHIHGQGNLNIGSAFLYLRGWRASKVVKPS